MIVAEATEGADGSASSAGNQTICMHFPLQSVMGDCFCSELREEFHLRNPFCMEGFCCEMWPKLSFPIENHR